MLKDFLGNEIKLNDKVVIIMNDKFIQGTITNVGIDTEQKEYVIVLIDSKKTVSQKRFVTEVIKVK